MPKVVVMMSTYNGEKYIAEQVESILNQTEKDLQLIIHDDGSKDRTREIISKYAEVDNRIRFVNGGHKGYPNCFFYLMKNSGKADYYAFSDQDDVWLPNKLECAIDSLKKINIKGVLYFSNKFIVDEKLTIINYDSKLKKGVMNAFFYRNQASGCTMLFDNTLMEMLLDYLPKDNKIFHDSWIYKVSLLCADVYYDQEPHILYRQHLGNTVGAPSVGVKLFFEHVVNFDWKLKSYRCMGLARRYALLIDEGYKYKIKKEYTDIIEWILNSNQSLYARIRLFFASGLSRNPAYEYFWIKLKIIVGWL